MFTDTAAQIQKAVAACFSKEQLLSFCSAREYRIASRPYGRRLIIRTRNPFTDSGSNASLRVSCVDRNYVYYNQSSRVLTDSHI